MIDYIVGFLGVIVGFIYGMIFNISLTRRLVKSGKVPPWVKEMGFIASAAAAGAKDEKADTPS